MANHDPQGALNKVRSFSAMSEVVESCNRFAFDLHSKLASQPGNLFFSPSSISMALAMTLAGANEDTSEEMADRGSSSDSRGDGGAWRATGATEGVSSRSPLPVPDSGPQNPAGSFHRTSAESGKQMRDEMIRTFHLVSLVSIQPGCTPAHE